MINILKDYYSCFFLHYIVTIFYIIIEIEYFITKTNES